MNSQSELSLESGSVLLENDTLEARRAIKRFVKVDLSDHQFGALAAFVFNVGETNFKSSTMLRKINDEDFAGAAKQFGRWVKADGVVLPGLVKRRACEATHFKGEARIRCLGQVQPQPVQRCWYRWRRYRIDRSRGW
ncbi:lysozyme [Rhizobium sp. 28DA2]|uniref:lysozyme n=1 Tax=Rhizobium sp. 28DA2 TaxID=3035209 RepID=UPI0034E858D3